MQPGCSPPPIYIYFELHYKYHKSITKLNKPLLNCSGNISWFIISSTTSTPAACLVMTLICNNDSNSKFNSSNNLLNNLSNYILTYFIVVNQGKTNRAAPQMVLGSSR